MKISCGTDIIEICRIKESDRIKQSIENLGDAFLNRVFTENEIKYCESKNNQKYQHYAARFTAKEAVFKAVSSNLKDKYSITWKDIEVCNNEQGKPYINLYGINQELFESIDISISHCKKYATANVVILQNELW